MQACFAVSCLVNICDVFIIFLVSVACFCCVNGMTFLLVGIQVIMLEEQFGGLMVAQCCLTVLGESEYYDALCESIVKTVQSGNLAKVHVH